MYRLNLFILSEIANNINSECVKDWEQIWVFGSDYNYGSEVPCEKCEKRFDCDRIDVEYLDYDYHEDNNYNFAEDESDDLLMHFLSL